ncbi:MAG: recombinase family protein, partial [Bacteroidota bacterium]
IWMGGPPPLGYDVVDRQLVVNKKEAAMVNHIFYRFIKLRSIKKLLLELKNDGYRTKQYISQTRKPHGGKVIGKTYLYRVLRNKMYLGLMPHKGKIYQGRHKPIISDELWEDAHKILNTSPAKKTAYNRTVNKSMLRNIITCECCNSRFVPVYTTNRNKKYRYYSPHNELNQHNTNCKVGPLAAGEIESLVLEHLKQLLTSPEIITHTFEYINKNYSADIELNLIKNKFQNFEHLWSKVSSDDKQKMVEQLVHQIRVSTNNMQIQLRLEGFRTVINEYADMKG